MDIQQFREKYPKYNHIKTDTLMEKLNAKKPGFLTATSHAELKPGPARPEKVGALNPLRLLPGYAHRPDMTPSDIGRAGAEYYFKTQIPESEMRERVSIALPKNEKVNQFRHRYPQYNHIDDITLFEKLSAKLPQYKNTLNERYAARDKIYKKIDIIEHKKAVKLPLSHEEAMINTLAIPMDNKTKGQQAFIGVTNGLSYGVTENMLNHMGVSSVDPETGMESVMRGGGSLVGFIGGPLEGASKVLRGIPVLKNLWQPVRATYKAKPYLVGLLRSGVSLGTAEAMMMPTEAHTKGIFQPDERAKQFGSGFITGVEFGAISYIPSKVARMFSASLLVGVPSTLNEESLEEQIFNYGFGAYMGIHGSKEAMKNEAKTRLWMDKGVQDRKGREQLFKESRRLLRKFEKAAKTEGEHFICPFSIGNGETATVTAKHPQKKVKLVPKGKQGKVRTTTKNGQTFSFKTIDGIEYYSIDKSPWTPVGKQSKGKQVKSEPAKIDTIIKDMMNLEKVKVTDMNITTRKAMEAGVRVRLKELKAEKGYQLRNDKVSDIFEGLKTRRVSDLTNVELYNLQEHIRPEATPKAPTHIFETRPPTKAGVKGKTITLYHQLLRLGYSSLEHLGFGGLLEEGLTGNVVKADRKDADIKLMHKQLTNIWKRLAGTNPETSRRLAMSRDGQFSYDQLVKNHPEYAAEKRVSKQIEQYWKTWLDVQNRHRAKYGQKPIKAVDNYYTHIFDATTREAQLKNNPYPDTLADMQEHIIPKEGKQPFLQKRTGAKGYKMDIWGATDAYAYWGGNYITDDALRQSRRISKFIGQEIKVNEHTGKQSPVDWVGIKKNVDGWGRRYSGQPGQFDIFIKNSVKVLPPEWQNKIGSIENLSGMYRTLMYTGAMGWRPKLALRNIGQHSLIIGMVGPKYLVRALSTRRSLKARQYLKQSNVLATRELGFAPELPHTIGIDKAEQVRNSAFAMFRQADRLNVENAFLAGYYEGRDKGLNHAQALKRGDQVAATTQFMYTKGNRGPISDLWGLSHIGGKMASMFTTWPINKIEYDLMIAKPENRPMLARYLAVVGVGALASVATNGKFKSTAYTGFGAEAGIFKKIAGGIIDFKFLLKPQLQILRDVKKAYKDDDFFKLILYETNKNTPLWEKF